MAATTPQIAVDACKQLIVAATQHCSAAVTAIPATPVAQHPDWSAIDTGLTSLSTAFDYGTIVLGLIAIFAGLGWGYLVRVWAQDQARQIAKETMDNWLATEAPKLIRDGREFLNPDGEGPDTAAAEKEADDIGEAAG